MQHNLILGLASAVLFVSTTCFGGALDSAEKAVRLKHYKEAFQLYLEAAKNGNAEAQYQISNFYQKGLGVSASKSHAMHWLEKSASSNWAPAEYSLAIVLQDSDPQKSKQLIQRAAEKKYQPAVVYVRRGIDTLSRKTANKDAGVNRWFWAAKHGDISALEKNYSKFKNLEIEDENGNTAIFYAIENGSAAGVNWITQKGANLDHANKFGETPLLYSVLKKQTDILKKIIGNTRDINHVLPNGDNAVHLAVRLEDTKSLSELLSKRNGKPIDINRQNQKGETPLDVASVLANSHIVNMLERSGAKYSGRVKRNEHDNTDERKRPNALAGNIDVTVDEIAKAITNRNTALLKTLLVKHKQKINEKLASGETLLAFSVRTGHANAVTALLDFGVEIPKTIVHRAIVSGDSDVVNVLLNRGGKLLTKDARGYDAVDVAIIEKQQAILDRLIVFANKKKLFNKNTDLSHYLLTSVKSNNKPAFLHFLSKSKKGLTDSEQRDAYWYAAQHGNSEILAKLVNNQFPMVGPDKQGKTALYIAAEKQCAPCIPTILSHPKANIDASTISGQTPLMAAVRVKSSEIVKLLIKNGANIKHRNALGNSALITAVEADDPALVKILLEAGASPNRKNNNGLSAFDIAKRNNSRVFDVLKDTSVFKLF